MNHLSIPANNRTEVRRIVRFFILSVYIRKDAVTILSVCGIPSEITGKRRKVVKVKVGL